MQQYRVIIFILFSLFRGYCQSKNVVQWINENAIQIEDSAPDTSLIAFDNKVPSKFQDAKIFGFGEATHHAKEFFNIKAKFFKYLVMNQGVKTFIMEESFPAESGINEWISGGKGDPKSIAKNFSIGVWYTEEIINLLKWMRDFNANIPAEDQIRFYGMDIQNVKNINYDIRDFVSKYTIPVPNELLKVIDSCANKKVSYGQKSEWASNQIPKLNNVKLLIRQFRRTIQNENEHEFNTIIRALNYLIKYTYYVQHHYSQDRDLKMYENVKWIIENESKNGKAFIWAHNEHINNKGFGNYSKRKIYNLGNRLKKLYGSKYYSVGFDFGAGTLPGIKMNSDKLYKWKDYSIQKPFKGTLAATLFKSDHHIYFLDLDKVIKSEIASFFNRKHKQLITGGPGFQSKNKNLVRKKYSETYDGLIFVKFISIANSN